MQLVGAQPPAGKMVTVKVAVAELPHWSVAVTVTGVEELTGKQVVSGGLKVRLAATGQQVSTAKALKGTLVQTPHV